MFTFRPITSPKRAAAASFLALGLLAASCGDDPEQAIDLPTLGGEDQPAESAASGDDAAGPLTEAEATLALEEYRDCLLERLPPGSVVDVSYGDDGPSIAVTVTEDGVDSLEAEQACDPILAELERTFLGSAADIAERTEASERALQCLADKGFQNGGGLQLSIDEESGYLAVDIDGDDFDEAAYVVAEEECLAEAGAES